MTHLTFDSSPTKRMVRTHAPHGVTPEIVISIYPDGTIGLKEARRPARTEKRVEIGALYVRLVNQAVGRLPGTIANFMRRGLTRAEATNAARKELGL